VRAVSYGTRGVHVLVCAGEASRLSKLAARPSRHGRDSAVESAAWKTHGAVPRRTIVLQDFPMYAYIPAQDLARARAFYEGKLGWKPKEVAPDGVVYEFAKQTSCFLYLTPNAGTSKASQAFWQVDDIVRAVKELESRGIQLEKYDYMPGQAADGIMTEGDAKAAWFKDSEGNIMALIQDMRR
jgi:predicted enzyme related to lactoylglutathione lyase